MQANGCTSTNSKMYPANKTHLSSRSEIDCESDNTYAIKRKRIDRTDWKHRISVLGKLQASGEQQSTSNCVFTRASNNRVVPELSSFDITSPTRASNRKLIKYQHAQTASGRRFNVSRRAVILAKHKPNDTRDNSSG